MNRSRVGALVVVVALVATAAAFALNERSTSTEGGQCTVRDGRSAARVWNDEALEAIRLDFPAPTVHARNLFHLSSAGWDAWAAFDSGADALFVQRDAAASDVEAARVDAISFASHRVLTERYRNSIGRRDALDSMDQTLFRLCGISDAQEYVAQNPGSAAALGSDIANEILDATLLDGSLQHRNYEDLSYSAVNEPLVVDSDEITLADPDRWQPLVLTEARSQNGLPLPGGSQSFIGSNWGDVVPFALPERGDAPVLDPGPPPSLADPSTADDYIQAATDVLRYSRQLGAGETLDISPANVGNNRLGSNDGGGYSVNPITGQPYEPQLVDRSDYYRVIAEYWADGPTSETPPGHWNTLTNMVSDSMGDQDRRIGGVGDPVDRLQWDVKAYFAVNGALHDAAIAAWGLKAHYDSVRPISMIRYLGSNGTEQPALTTEDGQIEIITEESAAPGQRHAHLAEHIGQVAVFAWQGSPQDSDNDRAGVGWIRAVEWLPYQRPTFVTPAFASYVSGHSVFSRSAAEVLAALTGSEFFPGGLGTHLVEPGDLIHEYGPEDSIELQWATYFDASDEAGFSRLPGGIHIPVDDFAGRQVGSQVGQSAWAKARLFIQP